MAVMAVMDSAGIVRFVVEAASDKIVITLRMDLAADHALSGCSELSSSYNSKWVSVSIEERNCILEVVRLLVSFLAIIYNFKQYASNLRNPVYT